MFVVAYEGSQSRSSRWFSLHYTRQRLQLPTSRAIFKAELKVSIHSYSANKQRGVGFRERERVCVCERERGSVWIEMG